MNCPICSQLKDVETSFYKYDAPQYDHPLPDAAGQLIMVDNGMEENLQEHHVRCCPLCGTLYRYDVSYEYHVNGSEDEEQLVRMTPEEGAQYCRSEARKLEKIRQWIDQLKDAYGSLVDFFDRGHPSSDDRVEVLQQMEEYQQTINQQVQELQIRVESLKRTCPQIINTWVAAHIKVCQFYLDQPMGMDVDAMVAHHVAETTLQEWKQFLEGGEVFIRVHPTWMEGYLERLEAAL